MNFTSQLPYILTLADLYLSPFYILLIIFIVSRWSRRYADSPLKKYIFPALICRMLGGILLALIFHFYYGYGDAFSYFTGAHEIWEAFVKSPKLAWEILVTSPKNYSYEALDYLRHSGYTGFSDSYYAMFKISGITGLLCFGNYLPIALIFCLLSFWGTWMIFLVFSEAYPHLTKYIAITTLFVPSVIMWSNGILKEPLCMFGLGLCFYALNNILKRRHTFVNLLWLVFGAFILLSLKDYIFYLFLAAAAIWIYKTVIKTTTPTLRFFVKTFLYTLTLSLIIYMIYNDSIQNAVIAYFTKAENLQNMMIIVNKDYGGGSAYTLPTDNLSTLGILKNLFLSLNVSLLRPYLWECSNPLMFLNFLESFVTTILVIMVLFRSGFKNIAYNLKSPLLIFALVFSLAMAILVGFISFNFGTLIRYKVPFEPFFYTLLIILLLNKKPIIKKA